MREVELKAVVDDVALRRAKLEAAGAVLVYEGRLHDQRYDTAARGLARVDHVLRVRRYAGRDGGGLSERTLLDWKGPTEFEAGFKIREELSTRVDDYTALTALLGRLGYVVTLDIDREITQLEVGGATVRFEVYPRMDVLVEVEGEPTAIEGAIALLGMARGEFTSERLPDFVERFERRTGVRAAISSREMAGDYGFRPADG